MERTSEQVERERQRAYSSDFLERARVCFRPCNARDPLVSSTVDAICQMAEGEEGRGTRRRSARLFTQLAGREEKKRERDSGVVTRGATTETLRRRVREKGGV